VFGGGAIIEGARIAVLHTAGYYRKAGMSVEDMPVE